MSQDLMATLDKMSSLDSIIDTKATVAREVDMSIRMEDNFVFDVSDVMPGELVAERDEGNRQLISRVSSCAPRFIPCFGSCILFTEYSICHSFRHVLAILVSEFGNVAVYGLSSSYIYTYIYICTF